MKIIKIFFALCLCLGLFACASQITTRSSLTTTVYLADKATIMDSYIKVIQSLDHYMIKLKTENRLDVKYSHPSIVMGSATVKTDFIEKTGLTSEGKQVTGVDIVYTDITPLFSQDTTFSGADIIDRIRIAFNNYMKFKGIKYYVIENQ
jgi:hypothetical protein